MIAGMIRAKEKENDDLKLKITQVIAVTDSFSPSTLDLVTMSNSLSNSKLLMGEHLLGMPTSSNSCNSNLDPNATAYTPKCGGITSSEA
jgi:hypothetical protein